MTGDGADMFWRRKGSSSSAVQRPVSEESCLQPKSSSVSCVVDVRPWKAISGWGCSP